MDWFVSLDPRPFSKKIVIAVFDFGPEKHALHYTRHDTWTDSQEEGQQLNMATQCVFCEMTTWRRGGGGGGAVNTSD